MTRTKAETPEACPACSSLTTPHPCGNPLCDWVICTRPTCRTIADSYGRVSQPVSHQG